MKTDAASAAMEPAAEQGTPRNKNIAQADEEDFEETETGLVSGVKIELVDWSKYSRPCEVVILCGIGGVLGYGLTGSEWMLGYNDQLKLITAGLYWSKVKDEPWDLQSDRLQAACDSMGGSIAAAHTVACSLSAAGRATAALGWLAMVMVCTLGFVFIVQALDACRLFGAMRAKLPPAMLQWLGLYAHTVGWMLLLVLLFLTLLAYASLSPASLGGGLTYLGISYGMVRLAWLFGLLGLGVNLSLGHKLGEDHVVMLLDAVRGRWAHMAPSQKLVQVLLVLAFSCALLLWVRHVDWGALLLVYGQWAHAEHAHDHLSLFAVLAIFSMCTDTLALAADTVDSRFMEVVTWVLLVSKLLVVLVLICKREAFV